MTIVVPHMQTQEEARKRMEGLILQLKEKYGDQIHGFREHWTGYTNTVEGSAKGFSTTGKLTVTSSTVDIEVRLPFALKFFAGKIRSVVEEKVKTALG